MGEPIDSNTLIPLASLSKAVTATLIGALYKKGLLNINDPITKYIPDLKLPHNINLTIKDILCQRTGFHNFSGDSLLKLGFSLSEMSHKVIHFPLKNKTGVDYSYQNFFMGLLEQVVEKVTGLKFEEAARHYVFDPLQMNSATYEALAPYKGFLSCCTRKTKQVPLLYIFENEEAFQKIEPSPNMYALKASMGVMLNAKDLMKWLRYSMHPEKINLVSQEFIETSRTPQTSFMPKPYDNQFALRRLKRASALWVELGIICFMARIRFIFIWGDGLARPAIFFMTLKKNLALSFGITMEALM